MSIKKQYLKKAPVCKVTFKFANGHGANAESVKIVGEFNNWDQSIEPMSKLKSGEFSQTLKLEPGKEYQFRYLVDDIHWENEPEADKLVLNGIDRDDYNSVVVL